VSAPPEPPGPPRRMPASWLWMQVAIVVFVAAGAVIALVKL
jgi:hypothetical protein